MGSFLDWAIALPPLVAAAWLLLMNVATFALALVVGCVLRSLCANRQIGPLPDPLSTREVVYAGLGIVVNWGITVAAWFLWRAGLVQFRRDLGWRAWLDAPLLVLVMDCAMYFLHRVVHLPWFFPIHRLHHEYDRPRPLDLFVLNPLETLAFGVLWLVVIAAHSWSLLGLSIYLGINLGAGMLGHLGVEPLPGWWSRIPVLRQLGTSTFHAQHHQDLGHNFGFYT
ncbi:MAG TPA: sterol desaturase family protein, partial [Isosphaeraceae bacterium]|nr:sterol desaturase family protein [Isosphaeraceae bacterium]